MGNSGRVIVFAPHPDDEILGCGGTIAKKVNEGYDIFIVFLTDGRNHFLNVYGITSDPTPDEYKIIRANEAKRALNSLGVDENNLLFLNFEDGLLGKNKEVVQKNIIRLMNDISPIEIYFPRKGETHPDHHITNIIIQNAIKISNSNPIGYQYSIWPKFGRFNKIIDMILSRKCVHIDIVDFKYQKKLALEEYKSQVTIFSSKQKKPTFTKNFLDKFLRNEEYFVICRFENST